MLSRRVFLKGSVMGLGALALESRTPSGMFGTAHADNSPAINPAVEVEEDIYSYEPPDNGAGPLWGMGAPMIVRDGETLFMSGLETLPDEEPLHNVRWKLYKRDANGWELQQADEEGRTREPCPIGIIPGEGRLMLSANPTLTEPGEHAGPAEPQLLEFDVNEPRTPPASHVPPWDSDHDDYGFSEHTYRHFAVDPETGGSFMLNQIGWSHRMWALHEPGGAWSWGRLDNVPSEDRHMHAYRPDYHVHRVNYGSSVLKGRAVHVTGRASYANWDGVGEEEMAEILDGETARSRWGSTRCARRMVYAWTPDVTSEPFSEWIEVGTTMPTGGWLNPGDLWAGPDDRIHILWYEAPPPADVPEQFLPDEPRLHSAKYAVVRDGEVVHRATLIEGVEEDGDELPGMLPRFHIGPDNRLFVLYTVSEGSGPVTENRLVEVDEQGAFSDPIVLPLQSPFSRPFTATPRGGTTPSDVLDLFGIRVGSPSNTLSYARVRLA